MRCQAQRFVSLSILILASSALSGASSIDGSTVIHKQARRGSNQPESVVVENGYPQPSASRTFADHATEASAYTPSETACGFATPCYSTIRAPEPQSLVLVGSGLIAMAGLIRRRLAR